VVVVVELAAAAAAAAAAAVVVVVYRNTCLLSSYWHDPHSPPPQFIDDHGVNWRFPEEGTYATAQLSQCTKNYFRGTDLTGAPMTSL